jgi:hypothetical protein
VIDKSILVATSPSFDKNFGLPAQSFDANRKRETLSSNHSDRQIKTVVVAIERSKSSHSDRKVNKKKEKA